MRPILETLRSFDDEALQSALRAKYGSARVIGIGREPLVFLSGINRVWVAISPLLKEYGLTEEAAKTSIELRLRRNGIKVYDVPDDTIGLTAFMISHPDSVFSLAPLSLTIDSLSISLPDSLSKADFVAAFVGLSQGQIVDLLFAERLTFAAATTWYDGRQVFSSRENVSRVCREAIDELVDKYCNDWLAAHTDKNTGSLPKDQGSTVPQQ